MLVICSNKTSSASIRKDVGVKRLIVGNKQRCLTCKRFVIKIGVNSKVSNLQPIDQPYKHADDCPQKGRF